MSFSPIPERSRSAPKFTSAKHISSNVVINPPEATSCPAAMFSSEINACKTLKTVFT